MAARRHAAVAARLREVRAAVAAGALETCPACLEDVPSASLLRCLAPPPAAAHTCCVGCFQRHVVTTCTTPAVLVAHGGDIPCIECSADDPLKCASPAWEVIRLEDKLDKDTRAAHWAAVKRVLTAPKMKAEAAAAVAARIAAAAAEGLARLERVRQLRAIVADADLTLKCPRCPARFDDYAGCNALRCGACGCGFCGLCLADCGVDAHEHYRTTHSPNYFDRPLFERTHREAHIARLAARIRSLAPDSDLQRVLVEGSAQCVSASTALAVETSLISALIQMRC